MKRITIVFFATVIFTVAYGQDARVEPIGKTFHELNIEYDLSTPLNAYTTFYNIIANGKDGKFREVSTTRNHKILPHADVPDKVVDEQKRSDILGQQVIEVRQYTDSIAAVIYKVNDQVYIIGWLGYEDSRWVNCGEDLGIGLENAREISDQKVVRNIARAHRVQLLDNIPNDVSPFVDYLRVNAKPPKDYILDKLTQYQLVICGEIHRRCISWAFMKDLVHDSRFAELAGTVFVELPSWKQDVLDKFYAEETMNKELILDVMRAEQIYGWWDGGEYEFLLDIWQINSQLPADKRIRVIAADWQMPWDDMRTAEDVEEYNKRDKDRNTHMADVIEANLMNNKDGRAAIFTVGFGHVYKSKVAGGYSSAKGQQAALTVGAQLTQRLTANKVFLLFPHVQITDNVLGNMGLLRGGVFDKAFEMNGNRPVGFDIVNSPFGAEPFDGTNEMRYDPDAGCYADNFDGYIFFGPLSSEGKECHIYDIFSDEFVIEIQRRAKVMGWENETYFFGTTAGALSRDEIIKRLSEQ